MSMRWLWWTMFALALGGGTLEAQQVVTSPVGVREVAAAERRLIPLSTRLRYTTMIILPDGEEILDVVCGDKEFWVINAAHNIAHLKPAKEGAATNLNLVTASGSVYSFLLTESAKTPADLKVYVTEDPDAAPKQTKYYSAKEMADMQAALADARTAVENVARRSDETFAEYRKSYPSTLQFNYAFPPSGKPFFVTAIWHDETHTYIKADARELPTLYEVTDGDPALVNFQVDHGIYVVPEGARPWLSGPWEREVGVSRERPISHGGHSHSQPAAGCRAHRRTPTEPAWRPATPRADLADGRRRGRHFGDHPLHRPTTRAAKKHSQPGARDARAESGAAAQLPTAAGGGGHASATGRPAARATVGSSQREDVHRATSGATPGCDGRRTPAPRIREPLREQRGAERQCHAGDGIATLLFLETNHSTSNAGPARHAAVTR